MNLFHELLMQKMALANLTHNSVNHTFILCLKCSETLRTQLDESYVLLQQCNAVKQSNMW